MIKNLLIDLDGTLTDPKIGITSSARYGLAKVGFPIQDDINIDWIIGPPLKASLAKLLNVDVEDDLAEQALLGYRERFSVTGLYENKVYPNVQETLATLKLQGYRLFIATAKPTIYAVQILEHFGLAEYFEHIYGSELTGERTNKGDLIEYILKMEQIKPEECVMVGDREHDILGAKRNQIPTIAVTYGYGSAEELAQAKPIGKIENFAQLNDFIKDNKES